MSWLIKSFFIAGVASMMIFDAQGKSNAKTQGEGNPKVTIRLYDNVHVPKQLLQEVEKKAGRIFQAINVDVEWTDCPTQDQDPSSYPECPEHFSSTDVILHLVPKAYTTRLQEDQTGGGAFAQARWVNIFWSNLQKAAQATNGCATSLFAHTIAHEIGHVLLGPNAHSAKGIMSAEWGAQTLIRMNQEGLYFTDKQGEYIRTSLLGRTNLMAFGTNQNASPK